MSPWTAPWPSPAQGSRAGIRVNLQTSFLTPPFGFALFYLRGMAPDQVRTTQIYRGVLPFIVIQLVGLLLIILFPRIVTALL